MPYLPFTRTTCRALTYALVLLAACELVSGSPRGHAHMSSDPAVTQERTIGERLLAEAEKLEAEQRLEASYAALEKLEEAARKFQVANDRRAEMAVWKSIGQLHQRLNESREASSSFNRALVLSRSLKAVAVEIDLLNDIGQLAVDLGDDSRALNHAARARTLSRSIGHQGGKFLVKLRIKT